MCLTKHYAMSGYFGSGGELSASRPRCFTCSTHWVGPRAGL